MKRKPLVVFLAICAVFALAFGISACSEHTHTYGDWVVIDEPTCTEEGLKERSCIDGDDTQQEVIPATGHTEVIDEGVAPTCTEAGLTEGKHCAVCGEVFVEQEVIPALGHDYVFSSWNWSEDHNFAEAVFICSHNSAHKQTIEANITREVVTEATFESAGEVKYTATVVFEDITYSDYNTEEIPILIFSTEGLSYTLNSDGLSYSVSAGTATATDIVIPSTHNNLPVTNIAEKAFYEKTNIKSVTIPDSVTSIGISAFYNCTALAEINYNATECADISSDNNIFYKAGQSGEGITVNIGSNVTKIPAYLFDSSYLNKIVSVVFAENSQCTSIGSFAFSGCFSLENINIPDSVTYIGHLAFYYCTSLESIEIHDNVTFIGQCAFSGCTALTSFTVDGNNSNYKSIDGNLYSKDGTNLIQYAIGKTDTSFTVPDGVTSIVDWAFASCASLESVTIGNDVTYIGYLAFYNCTGLTSVIFENTSGWWVSFSSTATSGTTISSTSLADPATAATYLKSKYCDYYWNRT